MTSGRGNASGKHPGSLKHKPVILTTHSGSSGTGALSNRPQHLICAPSKGALHPSFRDERPGNITVWDSLSTLEPVVILQKFSVV